MEGIALFTCFVLPIIVMIFMALGHALRAFNRAYHARGPFAVVLALFGINMIEPAVNTPLIPLILSIGLWDKIFMGGEPNGAEVLLVTAPMAVLLLPAFGMLLSEPKYRELCLKVLALGVARWAVTTLIWYFAMGESIVAAIVLFFVGVALLAYCVRWGKRQLETTLTFEPQQIIWDVGEPERAA